MTKSNLVVMVAHGSVKVRAAHWFLERRLTRRTRADVAGVVVKVAAIRLYAAVACLVSMVLAAWIGAFVGVVSAHGWLVFRTLNERTLLGAGVEASWYQGRLFPVLLGWAALLLLTPPGYTVAFRAAAAAAGVLGYLHFAPPAFAISTRVAGLSHWLTGSGARSPVPYLLAAIAAVYLLQFSATDVFGRLYQLRRRPHRVFFGVSTAHESLRRFGALLLVLLMLVSVIWAVTVIRLAAAGDRDPRSLTAYGAQGGLYLGRYFVLAITIAVLVWLYATSERWLAVAVAVMAWFALAPGVAAFATVPVAPEVGKNLTHIGMTWGADSLWVALFVIIPAVVLGIYVVARLIRSP